MVPTTSREQTLRRLSIAVAIQWSGASLALPLLPLYLEHRGGTPTMIGPIMAAFPAAGLLTQFLLGHLVDRHGRRLVLIGALLAYALGSTLYALPLSAPWFTLARAIQGSAAGGFEVASLSAVSALFPEHERGRASSRIVAAQLFGIAVGPVLGSLSTVSQLGWVFLLTALASLLSAVMAVSTNLGDTKIGVAEKLPKLQWNNQLIGSLFGTASVGLCIGVYEACWTLLMRRHGASPLEIRLSWSLFAIPWVLLSRVGGWIADHWNRRAIAFIGVMNAAVFLAIYPHIHNPKWMVITGSFESIGASLAVPSGQSLLTQGADDRETGRRQGLSTTANTAMIALSSAVAGAMFAVSPMLPFTVVAIVAALLASTTLFWWRGVTGRIAHKEQPRAS